MKNAFITIIVLIFTCNIATANSILLTDRSSTVTYSLDQTIDAPVAFAYSAEDILLVKDMDGRFWVPGRPFYNLPPLRPGSKYRVVITKPVDLFWNLDTAKVKLPSIYHEYKNPSHFVPVEPTKSNMSILVTGLPPEGEIGIMTGRGICIGAAAFSNQEWVGVAAYSHDLTSHEINGASYGELFWLRLTDGAGKTHLINDYEILEGDDRFTPDDLAVIRLLNKDELDAEYGIMPDYPNPFSSTQNTIINLKDTCEIDLALFDIKGKRVVDIESGITAAGSYRFYPDFSGISSGVYIVRLRYGNYVSTRKMILVK